MPIETVSKPIYYMPNGTRKEIEAIRGERGPSYDDTSIKSRVSEIETRLFVKQSEIARLSSDDVGKRIADHYYKESANNAKINLARSTSFKAYYFFAPKDGRIVFDVASAGQYLQVVVAKGVSDGFNIVSGSSFDIPCESHSLWTKALGNIPDVVNVEAGDFVGIGCAKSNNPVFDTDIFGGEMFLSDYMQNQIANAARDVISDYYATGNPDALWADVGTLQNSARLHEAFASLCASSNGYAEQHAMGTDEHGNTMYYYETSVPDVRYSTERGSGQPTFPVTGGHRVPYKTVILSGGIHGNEINPSYVLFNLLKALIDGKNGMLRKMRNRVKFVFIPVACPSGFNGDTYENADGVNVNRSFPEIESGNCACKEAENIKAVIDQFGSTINLHMDIHTFHAGNFTEFTFTDSDEMAIKGCEVGVDIADRYRTLYPSDANFAKVITSCPNLQQALATGTTCTKYTQAVYGCTTGTIEAVGNYPSNGAWTTTGTRYIGMLLDYVVTMVNELVLK